MIAATETRFVPGTTLVGNGARLGNRNLAFDFTKGVLVLIMVVYHSLNYFRNDKDLLKYFHFLPASFIFITGFLIAHVYQRRAVSGDRGVHGRLFIRGLKLLAIFVSLNCAAQAFFTSSHTRRLLGFDFFLDHLDSIFLTGEPRAAIFEVLLPISYLLVVSAGLLWIARRFPLALPLTAGGALLACLLADSQGQLVFNFDLLSVGLLGMISGLIPPGRIDVIARSIALLLSVNLAYLAVVSYVYPTYAMNLADVPLTLLLLYAIGIRAGASKPFAWLVVLLGQYSLVCYIAQIAFLQIVFRIFRRLQVETAGLALAFIITLCLTTATAYLLDCWRRKSPPAAVVYKAIFA